RHQLTVFGNDFNVQWLVGDDARYRSFVTLSRRVGDGRGEREAGVAGILFAADQPLGQRELEFRLAVLVGFAIELGERFLGDIYGRRFDGHGAVDNRLAEEIVGLERGLDLLAWLVIRLIENHINLEFRQRVFLDLDAPLAGRVPELAVDVVAAFEDFAGERA